MSPTEMRPPQQTFLGRTNDLDPPPINMPQGKKPKPRGGSQTFIGEATPGPASGVSMGAKTLIGA